MFKKWLCIELLQGSHCFSETRLLSSLQTFMLINTTSLPLLAEQVFGSYDCPVLRAIQVGFVRRILCWSSSHWHLLERYQVYTSLEVVMVKSMCAALIISKEKKNRSMWQRLRVLWRAMKNEDITFTLGPWTHDQETPSFKHLCPWKEIMILLQTINSFH